MENHIMKTDLTITVNRTANSIFDLDIPENWEYLESTNTRDNKTFSIFRWAYMGGNEYLSRVIVIAGEWHPESQYQEKNKFFVRGSNSSQTGDLFKLHTFKSVQDKVNSICEKFDKWFEINDPVTKFPDHKRYGIRPNEVEIEAMTTEERSKYPERIVQP